LDGLFCISYSQCFCDAGLLSIGLQSSISSLSTSLSISFPPRAFFSCGFQHASNGLLVRQGGPLKGSLSPPPPSFCRLTHIAECIALRMATWLSVFRFIFSPEWTLLHNLSPLSTPPPFPFSPLATSAPKCNFLILLLWGFVCFFFISPWGKQ